MNQYQSTLYQLTESVGAVSMVNVEQIKKQQNLDYLQHLCTFIDRMNINPIWFENEDKIYQLAITYSANLSESYERTIREKQTEISVMRNAQKEKTRQIRNHKEEYQLLKEKYKLKKHQLYKFMYDNLRNKIREDESFRATRRDHADERSEGPEVVYYYPQHNEPMRFDHGYPQYPQYHNAMPPQQHYDPRMWPPHHAPPQNTQNLYPQFVPNPHPTPPQINPHVQPQINQANLPRKASKPQAPEQAYSRYLNEGKQFANKEKQTIIHNKPQLVLTNSKLVSPKHKNIDSPKSDLNLMQKSNIIASGEQLMDKIGQQVKQKSQKSISKDSGARKRESIRLQSRQDDDEFENLTVNSKKRESSMMKLSQKDSGYSLQQEQFDSIAHIKLGTESSAEPFGNNANNHKRFQSKIQGKQEKPIRPPSVPNNLQSKISQVSASAEIQQNGSNELQGISNIMTSKFSKNTNQQGERLHVQRPQRNSLNPNIRQSNIKSQIGSEVKGSQDIRKSNQSAKNASSQQSEAGKVFGDKLKTSNISPPKAPQSSLEKTDILKSNIGRAESNRVEKKAGESIDIYSSNMGHGSNNSKKSEGEKLFQQNNKPIRSGQSQTPSPTNIEVPQIKKSNGNNLRISIAQSQQMKGSNNILYSQAQTLRFSNKQQPAKTPPKLQKQQQQEQNYDDDFDIDDDKLEQSHLPISNNKQPSKVPEKSEVNIDISGIPTVKEIVKEKYIKLPNQTFQLKSNIQQPPKIAASSNLNESDSFFDQILEMPMNSRIAIRPSIRNFKPSVMPQSVESLKKLIDSGKIGSEPKVPSIHVIDPDGNNQKIQSGGAKKQQKKEEVALVPDISGQDRMNTSRSSNLGDVNIEQSKHIPGKQTTLIDQNVVEPQVKPPKPPKSQSEDYQFEQFDNLMEQSNIEENKSKKQKRIKLQEIIAKIEAKPQTYKDARGFDQAWFDRILKEQMKVKVNDIKNADKWGEIEKYYKQKTDKINKELAQGPKTQRQKQEINEKVQTPKSIQRQSNYDDLQYSQSNVKFQNKSMKPEQKRQLQVDSVNGMTESITINDMPKVEQKVTPKNIQNRYSRSSKPKTEVKAELSKNISVGKNAYDIDDPLNVAAFQNKKLLQQEEFSESDF